MVHWTPFFDLWSYWPLIVICFFLCFIWLSIVACIDNGILGIVMGLLVTTGILVGISAVAGILQFFSWILTFMPTS